MGHYCQTEMKKVNIYVIIGVFALVGVIVFSSWNSTSIEIAENGDKLLNVEIRQEERNLKLIISYFFRENIKTISEKGTVEIIRWTMKSINWNEFHIVKLEGENGNRYKLYR